MSVVYIISDHGKLNQVNETFEFIATDGKRQRIFPHKMDSLIIKGVVSIMILLKYYEALPLVNLL